MRELKHISWGVLATLLLLGLKIAIEHTPLGHSLEVEAFQLLQGSLSDMSSSALPVLVVDIRKLPGGKDSPTPRSELKALLLAIAKKRPRAIGVDIDFSPDDRGWITPTDPDFFGFCQALRDQYQMPIYLAVYRQRFNSPERLVGEPEVSIPGRGRRRQPGRHHALIAPNPC